MRSYRGNLVNLVMDESVKTIRPFTLAAENGMVRTVETGETRERVRVAVISSICVDIASMYPVSLRLVNVPDRFSATLTAESDKLRVSDMRPMDDYESDRLDGIIGLIEHVQRERRRVSERGA